MHEITPFCSMIPLCDYNDTQYIQSNSRSAIASGLFNRFWGIGEIICRRTVLGKRKSAITSAHIFVVCLYRRFMLLHFINRVTLSLQSHSNRNFSLFFWWWASQLGTRNVCQSSIWYKLLMCVCVAFCYHFLFPSPCWPLHANYTHTCNRYRHMQWTEPINKM